MSETWVRERFQSFLDEPMDMPDLGVAGPGRRLRRRRRAARVGGAGAALLMLASGISVLANISGRPHPAPATLGASVAPTDDGRSANYWFGVDSSTEFERAADGSLTQQYHFVTANWLGHDRGSVSAAGNGPDYPGATLDAAYGSAPGPGPFHTWDAQWTTPTDRASVLAYLGAINVAPPSALPDGHDRSVVEEAALALTEPGPASFREAILAAVAGLPEVARTTATDDAGRPATLLTFTEADTRAQFLLYVEGSTLLETVRLSGAVPNDLAPVAQPRMQDLWTSIGPVDSAPAATTIAQQDSAASIAANHDPSHPTCTPGKPDGPSALAAQLAGVCLPDPAPGFPHRATPDFFNSSSIRVFQVSTTPVGPDDVYETSSPTTVDIRVQAHGFVLSGATSPTPDGAGRVGHDTATGTTTVLGVTATETADPDRHPGLLFRVNGLGVEIVGGTSYAELVRLADSLHIPAAG